MSELKHYTYVIQPTRLGMLTEGPTPREAEIISSHFNYLQKLVNKGVGIFVGRTLTADEHTFGITVFEAASEEEAREVMNSDPAVMTEVMRADLFPFKIVLMGQVPDLDN